MKTCYIQVEAVADTCYVQVETVGDKYMLASGLPVKNATHARNIALVSLEMLDSARRLASQDDEAIKVCIYAALSVSSQYIKVKYLLFIIFTSSLLS